MRYRGLRRGIGLSMLCLLAAFGRGHAMVNASVARAIDHRRELIPIDDVAEGLKVGDVFALSGGSSSLQTVGEMTVTAIDPTGAEIAGTYNGKYENSAGHDDRGPVNDLPADIQISGGKIKITLKIPSQDQTGNYGTIFTFRFHFKRAADGTYVSTGDRGSKLTWLRRQ